SRRIELGDDEDEQEAMFARGWSDGLPLVPPSEERVLRMLDGTARDPQEVIGLVPPALNAATVEKIAVNAVMAGCKPEYLPAVLAAVEAVLDESFAMHGVLATTMFVGPVVIVNGPIRRRIGMNAKGNALGQGNRANSAIGRALQLVIRTIGEGRLQEGCPEHERTFREAGWSKARLYEELYKLCEIPGEELIAGAKGIAEGGPPSLAGKTVNKFRPGGLMIVRAGGNAGMFSGIIGGWSAGGPRGRIPVTPEVRP